ncbi:unnamed protein product [Rotaria magnacalcarata]
MSTYVHFEDLSNEIFFEIFDYLHALDIFASFTSLNERISSILQLIPLRIVVSNNNTRQQIKFLSSHLTCHDHQVISINIDNIRDNSSVINFLFSRHNFINLQSCVFRSMKPTTKFENVMQQMKNLNRLVVFRIYDNHDNLNESSKYDFTQTILMHQSSCLRSIVLQAPYDYLDVSNYKLLPSNLLSLSLYMRSSSATVSVHSIISILRFCNRIQNLEITISHDSLIANNNVNSTQTPSYNDNDLPRLTQLKHFNFKVFAICDSRLISYILRCMPNLIRFHFNLAIRKAEWTFPGELLDGHVWKQMLELHVPYLSEFDFHMAIFKKIPELDLDIIVNSFECIVETYSDWHMIIDRWRYNYIYGEEFVMLRTLNYEKHKSNINITIPFIFCDSFETRSTITTIDHHRFYSNQEQLKIYLTSRTPLVTWSLPLFQQVTALSIFIPKKRLSLSNTLFNIFKFRETNDDDVQEHLSYLSRFVYLPNITEIVFGPNVDVSGWKDIPFILHACPNITNLIINTRLLVSKLIDDQSLISVFKKIKMIESIAQKIYFPSNFAWKFVQCFPSLSHIELQVFSFDNCVFIIDIFLTHLKNLSYIKINFYQHTLLEDPFSRDYIIDKRRQLSPTNMIDEQMIGVKRDGETVEIWLS